ncbi:hypothetical protein [Candidatus Amarolinea dominans]|uniref:hypothetical protein n=1 Tax=Candidatus Amarolinea dominans TaxID=3140696 RepID=UPI0031CCD713
MLIAQGTAAGVFDAAEQNIMRRTLRLGDRTAATLMTRGRTSSGWTSTTTRQRSGARSLRLPSRVSRGPRRARCHRRRGARP